MVFTLPDILTRAPTGLAGTDEIYHGHITVTDSIALEKIQNRAARLVTGAFRRTSTENLLNELGWTSLHIRRDINT